jgi:phosphoribosylformylglycinamidine synthase subunit PurL
MNFGNPQKPRIMGQFAGCIQGMADACKVLDFPVVSGNVSLYNETNGEAILPTPAIGGVGLLSDATLAINIAFKAADQAILLIGESSGHVGQSLYLREIHGREEGSPPPVDLAIERRNGDFVRSLISGRAITACHDLSDGGLLVTLAEMAMAGNLGADIDLPVRGDAAGFLFGEDQARYVVTTSDADAIMAQAKAAGVPVLRLGTTGGATLKLGGGDAISVDNLKTAHEAWLPEYMAGSLE